MAAELIEVCDMGNIAGRDDVEVSAVSEDCEDCGMGNVASRDDIEVLAVGEDCEDSGMGNVASRDDVASNDVDVVQQLGKHGHTVSGADDVRSAELPPKKKKKTSSAASKTLNELLPGLKYCISQTAADQQTTFTVQVEVDGQVRYVVATTALYPSYSELCKPSVDFMH